MNSRPVTLVNAHADTEQKRKAIEAATSPNSPSGKKLNPARFTVTDEEVLKKLTGQAETGAFPAHKTGSKQYGTFSSTTGSLRKE